MTHRRRLGITVVIIGVIAISFVRFMQDHNWYQPRITQAQVRQEIKRSLPMGSTMSQASEFLDARGWADAKHPSVYTNRSAISGGAPSDYEKAHPDETALLASIDNAYPGIIFSGGIYMKFYFNAAGHLVHYELQDVYTGL